MKGALPMLTQTTFDTILNATSSPESAAGATLYVSPDGQTKDPSGPALVHVNRSVSPGNEKGSKTRAISGLIRECRPDALFGEQVEGAIGHGWLRDLEAESYAVGHCVLGAHSVGAQHIRQRLYWCGRLDNSRRYGTGRELTGQTEQDSNREDNGIPRPAMQQGGLAHTQGERDTNREERARRGIADHSNGVGNAHSIRLEEFGRGFPGQEISTSAREAATPGGAILSFWRNAIWHQCRDGKARRISPEPEIFPLAHGLPGRVGILRGAGNAIVPQVAQIFIEACKEIIDQP